MHEKYMRLAKRYQNAQRPYLFVNPLQAKHIPSVPSESLAMMEALGEAVKERQADASLVIGFAETATAIGLMVAHALGVPYIHTTREALAQGEGWMDFQEEHSHAQDQKLSLDFLREHITDPGTIVLVDDELSTGKTVRNMVLRLRKEFPELSHRKFLTASILYRLSSFHQRKLGEMGIDSVYLARLPELDYDMEVHAWRVEKPAPLQYSEPWGEELRFPEIPKGNPRLGVDSAAYLSEWEIWGKDFAENMEKSWDSPMHKVLVLGTEECMLPAILLGKELESRGYDVRCHATTRSPIGVAKDIHYPIFSGWTLESFYGAERATYLYDLAEYDLVLVVSDAGTWREEAARSLRGALQKFGCGCLVWIGGNCVV